MTMTKLNIEDILKNNPELSNRPAKKIFHTPKPPTVGMFERLKTLRVDTINGRVYNWDNRELGTPDMYGRVSITISNAYTDEKPFISRHIYRSHIIWWKAKGYWPRLTIDHKDVDCTNDRIGNLREATMAEQNNNKVWNKI
jgi:hypothetical protein